MDGIGHLSTDDPERRITGLVSPFAYSHRHSAILKHFRHECSSSSRPLASNVVRISSFVRTCTHSPARSRRGGVNGLFIVVCIQSAVSEFGGCKNSAGQTRQVGHTREMKSSKCRVSTPKWRTSRLVSIDDTPNRAPPEHSRGPSMDEHARLSHAKYERKIQRRVQMTRQSVRQGTRGAARRPGYYRTSGGRRASSRYVNIAVVGRLRRSGRTVRRSDQNVNYILNVRWTDLKWKHVGAARKFVWIG